MLQSCNKNTSSKQDSPDYFSSTLNVKLRHVVLSVASVPFPRVGHSHSRGQKPDQPDAHHQSSQEDHSSRGPQASMGLRKCLLLETARQTAVSTHLVILLQLRKELKTNKTNMNNWLTSFFNVFCPPRPKPPSICPLPCLLSATVHSGVYDAQTGDRGVPEEIQCQEETQGLFTCSLSPTFSSSAISSAGLSYLLGMSSYTSFDNNHDTKWIEN